MPPETPVTIPVDDPTVATAGLPLLHEPPTGLASDKVVVNPGQIADVPPEIAGGNTSTVTVTFAEFVHAPFDTIEVITLTVVAGIVVG